MVDIVFSIITLFAIYIACSCFWHQNSIIVSPTPIMPWAKRCALKLLSDYTSVDKPYKIAELGSGWGGMLCALTKKYKKANLEGYELSPWPYRFSKFRTIFNCRRCKVYRQDFFKADLSGYELIYMYLYPETIEALKPQFEKFKPGTLILSCSFPVKGWDPIEVRKAGLFLPMTIYLYKC